MTEPAPAVFEIPGRRLIMGALAFDVVATVAYWVVWFCVDREILASAHTEAYYAYENAFPLADGWMVASAIAAFVALARRRASALLWCVAAGTSSVFLGLLDVLFDLQNGIYRSPDTAGVAIEVVINLLTIGLGSAGIVWTWRQRRELARLSGF
jgi:hypothetical protein